MAECIFTGTGGGGVSSDELNARAAQVLAGRSYVGADTEDEAGAGTMPNIGGVQRTLHAGESMAIPQGYHDGTGAVAAASLAEQTPGTAAARDILAGKSAWVDGRRVDGNIPVVDTAAGNHRAGVAGTYGLATDLGLLWAAAPRGNAYYMRGDGSPTVCIEAEALGDAIKEQVLQGARATSKYGLKFEGAIPRWTRTGDIGGQGVVNAWENAAFAGDYGPNGRVVFMRVPGAWYINPDIMWAVAPAPTLLPQNIKQGVNILGIWGSMPDYSSTCVPFDGAHFDGVHLSGWASGSLANRYGTHIMRMQKDYMGGYTRKFDSYDVWWGTTPSVHLGAFKAIRATVRTETTGWVWDSYEKNGYITATLYLVRPGGAEHNREFTSIRSNQVRWKPVRVGGRSENTVTVEINVAELAEQAFIVVKLKTDVIRPGGQMNGYEFNAWMERIELIA